jgi:hypothetical protein
MEYISVENGQSRGNMWFMKAYPEQRSFSEGG